ncbi:endo alpha-1,4 polygalactosaminidase [Streptomyces sp. BPTC-684]|uniref:endo alpha-1,4 polygalactosaminidase n=1 Tax=Streptomyces sp. BPTC-684 TaxID=3043734 RepID=UPI0024B1E8FE|nr:endo alpha-1,4 polygalactosaminidase [Streptomyces sp. BPTC-684]WHM39034.1 endo alpha-1,4 polygalactosaminidase [Streptomyces sp. BPTC-684]
MRRLPLALVLLLLLVAGCSSSSSDEDDRPGPDESSAAPSPSASRPGPSSPSPKPGGARWQPRPGLAWQWQLTGKLDPTVDVPVYDVDGFNVSKAQVDDLHRRGRKVICYVSTGAWEDFRPDADRFPKSVLGKSNGWKGERWLDVRRTDVLGPLMAERFDMCREKGFDAVEPDNMDGYDNETGFPLTAAQQLAYNRLIARLAHDRGLAVGLKNDLDQIPELVGDFDFAVNEQCAEFGECDQLAPFVKAGKAVFNVEYKLAPGKFCDAARGLRLSAMRKELDLGTWRQAC